MPSDLSTLDLATLSAAESAILAILRSKTCQWEQDSADAAAAGNLSNAVTVQNLTFAADLLSTIVSTQFSDLFSKALTARFGDLTAPHRSTAEQVVDAIDMEVAAAQEIPELVAA